jgi:hypothetical protein
MPAAGSQPSATAQHAQINKTAIRIGKRNLGPPNASAFTCGAKPRQVERLLGRRMRESSLHSRQELVHDAMEHVWVVKLNEMASA